MNDPTRSARVKSCVGPQVSHDYVKTGGAECGPVIWINVRSQSCSDIQKINNICQPADGTMSDRTLDTPEAQ